MIATAQLIRRPERRNGTQHFTSDLRGWASIEKDADVIGLLLRSAYYTTSEEEREAKSEEAELIIGKNRSGPVGAISLTFTEQITLIRNCITGE